MSKRTKADSPTRTCSNSGCDKPLRAKGLCSTHYNQTLPNRHKKVKGNCAYCGVEVERSTGGGRVYGFTCSDQCRQWLVTPYCILPEDHPVRIAIKEMREQERPVVKVAPKPKPQPMNTECQWCGESFLTTRREAKYCTKRCGKKASKVRRRGRENEAPGEYTWAQVIRIFMRGDKRCAYCDETISVPEPDHVVPISRGGRNGIENILPSCSLCNADKGDMTPNEWSIYRAAKRKPKVRTEFDWREPRFKHLMLGEATGESYRVKQWQQHSSQAA